MVTWPVSQAVNRVTNEGPVLVQPAAWDSACSDEGQRGHEEHRHRVRKRIRIETPRTSFRQRVNAIWKHDRQTIVVITILAVGSLLGWLVLRFRLGE